MKKTVAAAMSAVMLALGAFAFAACDNGGDADKVTLSALPGESDVVAVLQKAEADGTEAYGVLGEPSLTNGQAKVPSAEVVIDFQKEWKELTGFDGYPQASLIARTSFAQENPEFIAKLTEAVSGNADWLAVEANVRSFEQALATYNEENPGEETTLAGNTYTAETIERCNLGYQSAQEVKNSVKDYLGRLGTAPDDGFFYAPPEASAQAETSGETNVVDIYMPDGTPAFAVANVFTEGLEIDGYMVNFHILQASQIGTIFSSHDDADLAIMPTIGAATNYSKGVGIQLVSTNVFGNLYIAAVNSDVQTLEDLKGKTINTPSASTTVQLLQYLLKENGIEYVA